MGQVDMFGNYVRQRLEHWGREFALHKDCEYLGHQSKNMLQVLIEHKGDMPGRAQGYKPLTVNQQALEIERIVSEIARSELRLACCMRAYYCGSGRRRYERFETALNLVYTAECELKGKRLPMNRYAYLQTVRVGFDVVRRVLTKSA